MATILQKTSSNPSFWNAYCSIFIRISQNFFSQSAINDKQALTIIWSTEGLIHWRIYASPGLDELTYFTDYVTSLVHLVILSSVMFHYRAVHAANERRRYFVTTSLIGWVQI